MPELVVIKSLIVREGGLGGLLDEMRALESRVDAFITDTFDPETGASGATGMTHDWQVSRRLREATSKPLILAGGLTPQNVREAILAVEPHGVDAHTGLEGPGGRKDPWKVKAFVAQAKRGFAELRASMEAHVPEPSS
jgi:phosphoribosylanthranilate isomerase